MLLLIAAAPLLFFPRHTVTSPGVAETPYSLTSDVQGNAYVASVSYVNSNEGESFVTKVDPNGRLIYHVPGASGVPDKGGNLYSVPLNQRSACASKLDPAGNSL